MKKLLVFLSLFSLAFCAQAQAFEKGDVIISPGVGLGVYGVGYGLGFAVPVVLNADIGVHDYISVGAYGGFWTKKWAYTFTDNYRFTSIHAGVRASFHWWSLLDNALDADLRSDRLDIYITPWLGYNIRRAKWVDQDGATPSSLAWGNRFQGGAQIGVRYYFTDNVGVFAEWGGTPTAYSNWGLSFSF